MANIKGMVKKVTPKPLWEGLRSAKAGLFYFMHQVHKDYRLFYDCTNNEYIYEFNRGSLEGVQIRLPHTRLTDVVYIQREMLPYFSLGIPKNSTVIDAGAYPGDYSVAASKFTDTVIALEPDSVNRSFLEQVLTLNGVNDVVKVRSDGLAGSHGYGFIDHNGVGSTIWSDYKPNTSQVPLVTLDELVKPELDKGKQVVVKMDIEGLELDAIGASRLALESGVSFVIACYHIVNGHRTAEPLVDIFKKHDYKVELINPVHLTLLAYP